MRYYKYIGEDRKIKGGTNFNQGWKSLKDGGITKEDRRILAYTYSGETAVVGTIDDPDFEKVTEAQWRAL